MVERNLCEIYIKVAIANVTPFVLEPFLQKLSEWMCDLCKVGDETQGEVGHVQEDLKRLMEVEGEMCHIRVYLDGSEDEKAQNLDFVLTCLHFLNYSFRYTIKSIRELASILTRVDAMFGCGLK